MSVNLSTQFGWAQLSESSLLHTPAIVFGDTALVLVPVCEFDVEEQAARKKSETKIEERKDMFDGLLTGAQSKRETKT